MGATDEEYEEALDIICEGESFKSKIEGTFFFSNYCWKKRGLEILRILRVKHLKFRVSTNIGKVLRRNKFEVLCAERHTCYKYDHRKLGKKVRKHL